MAATNWKSETCTECNKKEENAGEFRRAKRNTVIYCPECDPLTNND